MTNQNNNNLTWIERLQKFRDFKVGHARLLDVTAEIKRTIHYRGGEGFIFLVGPTRTGKTTALMEIQNSIIRDSLDEMLKDPGFIPVAGIEAGCRYRAYDWRDHWFGCLEAIKEPLIERKSVKAEPTIKPVKMERYSNYTSTGEGILCRSFINAARHRKLRVFFIDEAQHLTFVRSSKNLRPQLEAIKSVANKSGAMHILCGHYDLLKLRNSSGQLGSRAVTIHFSRYRPDNEQDLRSFADALLTLTAQMKLSQSPDLSSDLDYCFERSLGCIGLLKIWLTDALGSVLENNRKILTRRDLERHEPPADVLDMISQEIINGEEMLEQDKSILSLVSMRLRKRIRPNQSPALSHDVAFTKNNLDGDSAIVSEQKNAKKSQAKKRSKIERAPKRDKVGHGRKSRAA
jgi:hypothetical protein